MRGTSYSGGMIGQLRHLVEKHVVESDDLDEDVINIFERDAKRYGDPTVAEIRAKWSAGSPAVSGAEYVPAIRNVLFAGHWVYRRMEKYGLPSNKLAGGLSPNGAPLPAPDQIRFAVVARWGHLARHDCDRTRLYEGSDKRHQVYDAACSTDGLMEIGFGVTLRHLVKLYVDIWRVSPPLFVAAWVRDYPNVELLCGKHEAALPTMSALAQIKDKVGKILATLALFYEWEREFDHLEFAGGANRMTEQTLGAALTSPSTLGVAVAKHDRVGRYLRGIWCHILPIAELFRRGSGGHAPEMPWKALGPGGNIADLDPVAGMSTDEAHAMASRSHAFVPPFGMKKGLKPVGGVYPAHLLNGGSIIEIALAAPLQMHHSLPPRNGRRGRSGGAITLYSALGRLGITVLSNICPDSADAQIVLSVANAKSPDSPTSVLAEHLIDNTDEWVTLADPEEPEGKNACDVIFAADLASMTATALASSALGNRIFEKAVLDHFKAVEERIAHIQKTMPGLVLGFNVCAWRTLTPAPAEATFSHPVQAMISGLPGLFSKNEAVDAFAASIAIEARVGITDPAQDLALAHLDTVRTMTGGGTVSGVSALMAKATAVKALKPPRVLFASDKVALYRKNRTSKTAKQKKPGVASD